MPVSEDDDFVDAEDRKGACDLASESGFAVMSLAAAVG